MSDDSNIDVLREGETKDEHGNPLTQRGIHNATIDGHTVRRAVMVGQDEVLGIDNHGNLTVHTREFYDMQEVSDLHCTCGEQFDSHEAALEHLKDAKRGELD